MEDEATGAVAVVLLATAFVLLKKRKRLNRRVWTRPWIQRRSLHGAHNAFLQELSLEDPSAFRNFLRMDEDSFMELLHLVTPHIKRRNTVMRDAIPPAERLSITLRFLATGDTYQSLVYLYRIPKQTLSTIIPETCTAIYNVLKERYLKVPSTPEEWERIANDFEMKWNFPNCIGAIDGKHITIRNPVGSGSRFYNYKGFYSIVLMAVVDADYNFIYIDIGCNGRISDGGIFARCSLHERLENSTMSLPPPKPLPGRRNDTPYIIVGDEAFPLKPYLLKPYPSRQLDDPAKQIFNYSLSRARRIVENVFGIQVCNFPDTYCTRN